MFIVLIKFFDVIGMVVLAATVLITMYIILNIKFKKLYCHTYYSQAYKYRKLKKQGKSKRKQ